MGNPRIAIGVACLLVAAALVAGATTLTGTDSQSIDAPASAPAAPVRLASRGVPRYGDCGDRRHGSVEPVACTDPRADVQVGARRALGDPATACPLYDRKTVLSTSGGVGSMYLCWVPIGGGPSRNAVTPALVEATTTEPEFVVGVCGDVHDQHVHAPMACNDDRADGVVTSSVADAGGCPDGTLLALPASTGRSVCWGAIEG